MTKEQSYPPTCIDCGTQNCKFKERTYPEFCLTTHLEQEDLEWALKQYNDNNKIMAASAEVEYEGYCRLTRVEEIMTFARKMGYKKLGIAYCIGLVNEARIFARILRANGFEVYSVICKVAGKRDEKRRTEADREESRGNSGSSHSHGDRKTASTNGKGIRCRYGTHPAHERYQMGAVKQHLPTHSSLPGCQRISLRGTGGFRGPAGTLLSDDP